MKSWPFKDPDEVLDYGIDWANAAVGDGGRLQGDTIASSTWTVPTGITKNSDTLTSTTTTIWLSGGTAGTKYVITNHIVTADGRHMDQSVSIKVKDK